MREEAKLCLAHEAGSKTFSYGGTLQGDVSDARKQLFGCARSAGFGKGSRVHAPGDGADWIALQVEERFGSQGSHLVDYYHMYDYLSAAAAAIHPEMAGAWFNQQKERLKSGNCDKVIESVRAHIGADEVADSEAAVRSCLPEQPVLGQTLTVPIRSAPGWSRSPASAANSGWRGS